MALVKLLYSRSSLSGQVPHVCGVSLCCYGALRLSDRLLDPPCRNFFGCPQPSAAFLTPWTACPSKAGPVPQATQERSSGGMISRGCEPTGDPELGAPKKGLRKRQVPSWAHRFLEPGNPPGSAGTSDPKYPSATPCQNLKSLKNEELLGLLLLQLRKIRQ